MIYAPHNTPVYPGVSIFLIWFYCTALFWVPVLHIWLGVELTAFVFFSKSLGMVALFGFPLVFFMFLSMFVFWALTTGCPCSWVWIRSTWTGHFSGSCLTGWIMFSSVCHFSPCFIINISFSILLGWRLFFCLSRVAFFLLGIVFISLCWALISRSFVSPYEYENTPPDEDEFCIYFFCVLVSITVPIVGVFDRYLGLDYWNICFLALETKMIKMPFFSHCHFTTATMRYICLMNTDHRQNVGLTKIGSNLAKHEYEIHKHDTVRNGTHDRGLSEVYPDQKRTS